MCKLVRHFHPKLIWWHGHGAYVGSANLTQSAWWNNVEAGIFLTETELVEGGHDLELEDMFSQIDKHAAPLTQELFDLLSARSKVLTKHKSEQKIENDAFFGTNLVPAWEGLVNVNKKAASDRRRQAFLDEWNSTLQIIRDIAAKVSTKENRPAWVSTDVPLGAQADQFLHAHYYQRTFDGNRADYERHFLLHRNDPDEAVENAIAWWRKLPRSRDEDTMLNKTAPLLRKAFSEQTLQHLDEDNFVKVLGRIHAARDYARRAPNSFVGLAGGVTYDIPQKVDALARHIYRAPSRGGVSVIETLSFILYGGRLEEVPQRLWQALHDPKLKVELLGVSALGEIVGWAMPDRYPPRNGRTSKALKSLGYDVTVHV